MNVKQALWPAQVELTVFGFPEVLRFKRKLSPTVAEYATNDRQVVQVERQGKRFAMKREG